MTDTVDTRVARKFSARFRFERSSSFRFCHPVSQQLLIAVLSMLGQLFNDLCFAHRSEF